MAPRRIRPGRVWRSGRLKGRAGSRPGVVAYRSRRLAHRGPYSHLTSRGTARHQPSDLRASVRGASQRVRGARDGRASAAAARGSARRGRRDRRGQCLNFAHYPQDVSHVMAVEPEPHLRRIAERAAEHAAVAVTVSAGTAEALPLVDDRYDAAVFALVLCSVAGQRQALGEARRVLKARGELRFYEHVAAHSPSMLRAQRAADATLWPHIAGGCHLARDTAAAISQAGFRIERIERFAYRPARLLPAAPHVLGSARAPG